MYPIWCESSSVRCIPVLYLREQQGPHIVFQGEHTYICLAELPLAMPETQPAASTVPGISRGEEVCDYIHHSWDTCGLEWQKTFADPGQWSVGQRELPVLFMYISAQVLSALPTTCWLISRPTSKWPLYTWTEIWLAVDKRGKQMCRESALRDVA